MAALTFADSAAAAAFVAAVGDALDLPTSAADGGYRQVGGGRHVDPASVVTTAVVAAAGTSVDVDAVLEPTDTLAELQAKIDLLSPGAVVAFQAGTYQLADILYWRDGLTAIANGAVTIQRGASVNGPFSLEGVAGGTFAGLTFDVLGTSEDRVLVNARGASDLRFTNCVFTDSQSAQANAEWTHRAILGGVGLTRVVIEDCTVDGCQLQLGGFGGASHIRLSRITAVAPLQYVVSLVTRSDEGPALPIEDCVIEDVTVTYPEGRAVGSGAIYIGAEIGGGNVYSECRRMTIRRVSVEGPLPNPYRAVNCRPTTLTEDWTIQDVTVTQTGDAQTSNTVGVLFAPREDTPVDRIERLTIADVTGTGLSRGALSFSEANGIIPRIRDLSISNVTGGVWDGVTESSIPQLLSRYGG